MKIAESAFWGVSVVSFFYALDKLDDTFVKLLPVLFVWGLSGLIVSVFLVKDMKVFWAGVIFSGSIVVALPLLLNDFFSDKEQQVFKVSIRHKHHEHSRSRASAEVEFGGIEKNVTAVDNEQVDTSSYILLTVSKGYLGYYLMKDTKFVKD
ncbi:hypothetical protein [Mucilaginibacter kameinonensis]|uniref:hypothetical protein n=1 Tax=Mucilaginibacter kameinonensis TaxID=452286 RepID=UPI0013CEBAB2|nr:hypothetical protein [Mucilaginibacter kameinonensis]